jgi:hypothetical protein
MMLSKEKVGELCEKYIDNNTTKGEMVMSELSDKKVDMLLKKKKDLTECNKENLIKNIVKPSNN